jgi:hypothetical protein
MAASGQSVNTSKIAGEAITKARFVDITSDETVDMCDAAADIVLGASAETVVVGDVCPITTIGEAQIELGATLAVGAMCSSGTNGVAVAASVVGGEIIVGPILKGGDSGEIGVVQMNVRTVNA